MSFPYFSMDYATAWGILLLRVVVGIIFIVHSLPKLRKPESMAQAMGWPKNLPTTLGLVEVVAGGLLILGYFIQYASLAVMIDMVGAIYYKIFKWRMPFFAPDKTGWELDLLLFASGLLIYLSQGGGLGMGI
ncbi:MAG: DoxX family protein [Candidatus Paceibacteria bacterium]